MALPDYVAPETYSKLRDLVRRAFPDARAKVVDLHVEAVLLHVWNKADDATCQQILGAPKPDPTVIDAFNASVMTTCEPDGHAYYLGHATHSRVVEPGKHSFTAHLPLVRVGLADTDATAQVISTSIGDVDPKDHLFQSVEQVAFKLQSDLPQIPKRVDVITPQRSHGARFGAIAIYLGYYEKDAATPSFFILEAGTATGDSMVYFLSPDMSPIPPSRKWFVPTPFTNEQGFYAGELLMNGNDPDELHVHSMNSNKGVEVEVVVKYESTLPKYIYPALLTAEAAARVGLIAIAKGDLVYEEILAPLGRLLEWIELPH